MYLCIFSLQREISTKQQLLDLCNDEINDDIFITSNIKLDNEQSFKCVINMNRYGFNGLGHVIDNIQIKSVISDEQNLFYSLFVNFSYIRNMSLRGVSFKTDLDKYSADYKVFSSLFGQLVENSVYIQNLSVQFVSLISELPKPTSQQKDASVLTAALFNCVQTGALIIDGLAVEVVGQTEVKKISSTLKKKVSNENAIPIAPGQLPWPWNSQAATVLTCDPGSLLGEVDEQSYVRFCGVSAGIPLLERNLNRMSQKLIDLSSFPGHNVFKDYKFNETHNYTNIACVTMSSGLSMIEPEQEIVTKVINASLNLENNYKILQEKYKVQRENYDHQMKLLKQQGEIITNYEKEIENLQKQLKHAHLHALQHQKALERFQMQKNVSHAQNQSIYNQKTTPKSLKFKSDKQQINPTFFYANISLWLITIVVVIFKGQQKFMSKYKRQQTVDNKIQSYMTMANKYNSAQSSYGSFMSGLQNNEKYYNSQKRI